MFGIKTYVLKKSSEGVLRAQYVFGRLLQFFRFLPQNDREIVAIFKDQRPDTKRYRYSTLEFFAEGGYNIYFYQKVNFRYFYWLGPLTRQLFWMKSVKFITSLPKNTESMILMFDHAGLEESILLKKWKKIIFLSVQRSSAWQIGKRTMVLPYRMYPKIGSAGRLENLKAFQNQKRRVRTFFAGSTEIYYENPVVKKYGQMTRREGLNVLLQSGRKIIYRPAKKEFKRMFYGNRFHQECVIFDFLKFQINPKSWLDVLSRSDFFICFSGTDYPICHNLIESLAVGTIPIVSYPEWVDPPLEHGKNALIYRNAAELIERFDEAMSMPLEGIKAMRQNAAIYYERHLSPKNFAPRFEVSKGPLTLSTHPRLIDEGPDIKTRSQIDQLNARICTLS